MVLQTALRFSYCGSRGLVSRVPSGLAGLNPETPYALPAFALHFLMDGPPLHLFPAGPGSQEIDHKAGLKRVRVGNIHLLRKDST